MPGASKILNVGPARLCADVTRRNHRAFAIGYLDRVQLRRLDIEVKPEDLAGFGSALF